MGIILKHKFTLTYIFLIAALGWIFVKAPLIHFPDGSMLSPAAFLVGLVFVLRDFAQREIGHKVIYAMLTGAALTFIFADPAIAIAGTTAFFVSEIADWLVYTYTKLELSSRILLSSLVAVPIDSFVVLWGLAYTFPGVNTFGNFILLTVVKLVVACLIAAFVVKKK